jgi:hypothetical protein
MSTSADTEREPAVSRIYRAIEPPNRQHMHQKAEGEDEWNARKHGGSKRRVWRKIHIGIDEETLEVRAVQVTGSNIGDAPMLPELLNQIPSDQDIVSVTADGVYDTGFVYKKLSNRHVYTILAFLDEYNREPLFVAVRHKITANDFLDTLHPMLMKYGKPEFTQN